MVIWLKEAWVWFPSFRPFIFPDENGNENPSDRRLVVASKVNDDVDFYRNVMDLVDTLLYSHQVNVNSFVTVVVDVMT